MGKFKCTTNLAGGGAEGDGERGVFAGLVGGVGYGGGGERTLHMHSGILAMSQLSLTSVYVYTLDTPLQVSLSTGPSSWMPDMK